MTLLDDTHWRALRALGKLSAGMPTFLNVVDADALVLRGLAERYGAGQFVLTDAGRDLLDRDAGNV